MKCLPLPAKLLNMKKIKHLFLRANNAKKTFFKSPGSDMCALCFGLEPGKIAVRDKTADNLSLWQRRKISGQNRLLTDDGPELNS